MVIVGKSLWYTVRGIQHFWTCCYRTINNNNATSCWAVWHLPVFDYSPITVHPDMFYSLINLVITSSVFSTAVRYQMDWWNTFSIPFLISLGLICFFFPFLCAGPYTHVMYPCFVFFLPLLYNYKWPDTADKYSFFFFFLIYAG